MLGALNRAPGKAVAGLADWKALSGAHGGEWQSAGALPQRGCARSARAASPADAATATGMEEFVPEAPTEVSRVDAVRRNLGGVWVDDDGETATSTSPGLTLLHLPPTEAAVMARKRRTVPTLATETRYSPSRPGGRPSGLPPSDPAAPGGPQSRLSVPPTGFVADQARVVARGLCWRPGV